MPWSALHDRGSEMAGTVQRCGPDDPRLYVRIAVQIRGLIESGELEAGDPVPSFAALVQEHGVARQTAAKALQLLEDAGLTRCVPGLGYYVKKPASRS